MRIRDVVAEKCPFCGAKGKVRCESRKRRDFFNDFGAIIEYRTYHIRCTACNARGGTVGGFVGQYMEMEDYTVKINGEDTVIHSGKYFERKALEKWNRRY